MKLKIFLPVILIILMGLKGYSQGLYINPGQYTPQQLVEDILVTGCLQAFNVTYTGDPLSKGYFENTANPQNFPFAAGVILSSGYVLGAIGPNNSSGVSSSTTGVGDPNLNALIPQTTQDAAIIEFDFIPADGIISFNYIFGSDEYLEWVNTQYNDVFAFFLTGQNPTGTNYLNTNIALIPVIGLPVSINNINSVANNAYYINNGAGNTPNNEAIEYDGYTVAMTAIANVVACQTYHIKLAIADAIDTALDSGVFLEAGSMISGEVVSMSNYNPVGANNTIIEGCENYYIFTRTDTTDLTLPLDILLNISGTASVGTDISGFPVSFSIPVNQTCDTVFYSAFMDNITEGTEYLIFTLLNGCPCTIGTTSDTIWVIDNVTMVGGIIQSDTLICDTTSIVNVTLNAFVNTDPSITSYLWSTGSTNQTITVQPPAGAITTYYVEITDDCSQIATDSITITVSNMSTLTISPTHLICNNVCNGSVLVEPNSGFSPFTYSWNPGGLGGSTTGEAFNLCAGSYSVTSIDYYGCVATESFVITEPPAVELTFIADSATCPGASDGALEVTIHNGVSPFLISCTTQSTVIGWTPNSYTFGNIPAGNYTVNVVDGNGCLAAGIFPVGEMVLSFSTNITDVQCFGESSGDAQVVINGGTTPYSYIWTNGQTSSTLMNVSTGNYTCTVTDAHNCQITVPVTIIEPNILTMTNSVDTLMCLGETATLHGTGYGGTVPYTFNWSDGQTGDVIDVSPATTTTYVVYVIDDNNCESEEHELTVELYPAVAPVFYANIDSICKGESTNLYVDVSGGNGGPYVITDENGDIIIPPIVVNPEETSSYSIFADDDCGSPQGSSSLTVFVMNPQPGEFTIDVESGCVPLEVNFTETSTDNGQSYLWDFGDNNDYGYSIDKSPKHIYETSGNFDIALTITSSFGCPTTVIFDDMITVLPKPDASFMADPNMPYIINPVVYFNDMSSGIITDITFDFGDGTSQVIGTGTFDDIMHVYSDTGTFVVQMIAVNSDECIDTAFQVIHVVESETFFTPNAINPNSAVELNRTFRPFGYAIDHVDYHLLIYDRWGNKVFETFNFNHSWDGRINGGVIGETGTYTWIAIYTNHLGAETMKSGMVTIVDN